MSSDGPGPAVTGRLGYLFKHAQQRMEELNTAALARFGIDGRELGVLLALGDHPPTSQQQVAQRMGIDRTTMVAMLDTLQGKGLVARRPHADDRRRNVVELTDAGRGVLGSATTASDAAEADLLAALDPDAARLLRAALRAIVVREETGRQPSGLP